MFPFINIFNKEIGMYAVMAAIGIIIAVFFAESLAVRRGVHKFYMIEVLMWSGAGVVIGSHLLYAIINIDSLVLVLSNLGKIKTFKIFIDCMVSIFGGSVFYGGLLGGVLAGYLVIKKQKYPLDLFSDIAACTIPLLHGFARIGCFLGGCCYGVKSDFGFTYTISPLASANGVSRFPVQLLEAAFEFCLFAVILILLNRKQKKGRLLPIYFVVYGIGRFLLEFLRGDDELRKMFFGVSTSQWIAIITVLVSATWLVLTSRKSSVSKSSD